MHVYACKVTAYHAQTTKINKAFTAFDILAHHFVSDCLSNVFLCIPLVETFVHWLSDYMVCMLSIDPVQIEDAL